MHIRLEVTFVGYKRFKKKFLKSKNLIFANLRNSLIFNPISLAKYGIFKK